MDIDFRCFVDVLGCSRKDVEAKVRQRCLLNSETELKSKTVVFSDCVPI